MTNKFVKIWQSAKPYYEKGRPMDVDHIEWMMGDALRLCEVEELDVNYLLPLVILHDVGYANVPKDNPFNLDLRRMHMAKGARIAKDILTELEHSQEVIDKISYYVSVHDNWALGDNEIYKQDKVLGSFTDLDFIWMATPKGFHALMKILNKTPNEMIEYLRTNEKLIARPFTTIFAKNLFEKYLSQRTEEFKSGM